MGVWRYSSTSLLRRYVEVDGSIHAPAALPPVPIGWEAGWAPEPGWMAVGKRKILHCRESNRCRPARRYTDWAIPNPIISKW
jgi:hypothetical protein